jgi:hypothetical protein
MKVLIIILVLVGVSFVGLLVYGGTGSQDPKKACQQITKDGDDWKVPDNWCPPSIAKATRSLQVRFAPGLGLKNPKKVVRDINPQQDTFFDVPPVGDTDKHRTAKLTLLSGDWAIVEGPSDAKQCLCAPKQPIPAQLQGGACGARWQEDHLKTGWTCQSVDQYGTIPIEWMGGRLSFKAGPKAQVEVK